MSVPVPTIGSPEWKAAVEEALVAGPFHTEGLSDVRLVMRPAKDGAMGFVAYVKNKAQHLIADDSQVMEFVLQRQYKLTYRDVNGVGGGYSYEWRDEPTIQLDAEGKEVIPSQAVKNEKNPAIEPSEKFKMHWTDTGLG